jgi:hypothetical protein
MTTQEKIKYYLSFCKHLQCVEFALYCAKDVAKSSGVKDERVWKCIDLVEKWLDNPAEVSNSELSEASHAASYAAYAAAHAAYAASSAAYASHAASHAASYAAYAAAHAAHAAYAASSAEDKNREQLTHLLTNILKLNAFDKLMANI